MRDDYERYMTLETTSHPTWGTKTIVSVGSNKENGEGSLVRTIVPNVTLAIGCTKCDSGFQIPDGT